MKVKELIKRLQKFDQELEVVFQNPVCEFTESVVVDSCIVKSALQDEEYNCYYRFVPEELNSPEYPKLKIQQVLWLS